MSFDLHLKLDLCKKIHCFHMFLFQAMALGNKKNEETQSVCDTPKKTPLHFGWTICSR